MIKILPSSTSAIVQYGFRHKHRYKTSGRLGDGAKEHTFEIGQTRLHTTWQDNRLGAKLSVLSELYFHSVTLDFTFKSPRSFRETTIWTEAFSDVFNIGKLNSIPGILSQKSARNGAWALWISENPDSDGIFFRQSPPVDYPIRFYCNPLLKILKIRWDINRMCKKGESLKLPDVGIHRGSLDKIVPRWKLEWKKTSRRELLTDRRTGWCGGREIESPKDLRGILSCIKIHKIKMDWFSIGPNYASAIGDWLLPSDTFKDRMGSLSRTIGEHGMIPGLAFAPFLVSKKSVLAEEHHDWLVRKPNGSPITVPEYAGSNDTLYVLDITRNEVVEHLRKTLSIMQGQWGFRAYYLERMGVAAIPGIRHNNYSGESILLERATTLFREILGNKVLLIASGLPLMTPPNVWDARVLTPQMHQLSSVFPGRKRQNFLSIISSFLHCSFWNESSWINASGLLPSSIFNKHDDVLAQSFRTAVLLSCGMVILSGDSRSMEEESWESMRQFLETFHICRHGQLSMISNIGGGSNTPLVVRNNTGWVGLFNLSSRKKEIRLGRDEMKTSLGVSTALYAGEKTVFNSPEIHVVLPPAGCRLFQG